MRKRTLSDGDLNSLKDRVGRKKYRWQYHRELMRSGRMLRYGTRFSGKRYENSPERLAEIREKYKDGITPEILDEFAAKVLGPEAEW